jgi:hypothetical protein
MKLGVNILNFGPGGSPDSLLGWARFAEQAGFSIAMMSDRGPLTPDVQALYPAPFYDPFVTLAWLAGPGRRWRATWRIRSSRLRASRDSAGSYDRDLSCGDHAASADSPTFREPGG